MSYLFSLDPQYERNQRDEANANNTSEMPEVGFFEAENKTDLLTTPVDSITAGVAGAGGSAALLLGGANELSRKAFDATGFNAGATTAEQARDFWLGQADEGFNAMKSLRPNPKTQGAGLQLVGSLSEALLRAIVAGPVGASVISAISGSAENIQEGKDVSTAAKMGAVTGLSEGLGIAAPAALGVKLATKVVSGAGMNIGFGMAERKTKSEILANAGYHDQAEQYKWDDKEAMLIDGVLGAAFGAIPGGGKDTRPTSEKAFGMLGEHITPTIVDTALVANESRHLDGLAPGIPTTPEAANAHVKAMDEMDSAIAEGRDPDFDKTGIYDAKFLPAPEKASINEHAVKVSDELKTDLSTIETAFEGKYYHPDIEQQIAAHVVENNSTVEKFAESNQEVYNGIIDNQYRSDLEAMAKDAGWSQKGGELLRDFEGNAVGRTSWLPQQPWFGDFVKSGLGSKTDLQKAVTKHLNDEKLGPKQKRIIEWLKDEADGKNQDGPEGSFSTIDRKAELNDAIQNHIEALRERKAIQDEAPSIPFDDSIPFESNKSESNPEPIEIQAANNVLKEHPDLMIGIGNGKKAKLADVFAEHDVEIQQAKELSQLIEMAAECALRS